MFVTLLIVYLLVNVLTFALMFIDTLMDKNHGKHLPEILHILLAVFGGGFGGIIGAKFFEVKPHKHFFINMIWFGMATSIFILFLIFWRTVLLA